jgi:hypothetical protein
MDPQANLAEQRSIAARIIERLDNPGRVQPYRLEHDAERLAELVQALDEWLTRGGFLPARWERKAVGS